MKWIAQDGRRSISTAVRFEIPMCNGLLPSHRQRADTPLYFGTPQIICEPVFPPACQLRFGRIILPTSDVIAYSRHKGAVVLQNDVVRRYDDIVVGQVSFIMPDRCWNPLSLGVLAGFPMPSLNEVGLYEAETKSVQEKDQHWLNGEDGERSIVFQRHQGWKLNVDFPALS